MSSDYGTRAYLSVGEVAAYTGVAVATLHQMVRAGQLPAVKSAGGQYRFRLEQVRHLRATKKATDKSACRADITLDVGGTRQRLLPADAANLAGMVSDGSVHLAITSPPYFNAKMYSQGLTGDLSNVHDLQAWLAFGKCGKKHGAYCSPGASFSSTS